jgi:hypothetical protein
MTVFWDIEPCSVVKVGRRFRDAYCLYQPGDVNRNMGTVQQGTGRIGGPQLGQKKGHSSTGLLSLSYHMIPTHFSIGPAKVLPCPTCSHISPSFQAWLTNRPEEKGSKHL